MYKLWTNIEIRFLKMGIIPNGRSILACRVFCRRNGVKYPGKKTIDENDTIIKRLDQKYSPQSKGIEMKKENLMEIPVGKIRENPNNPRTRIESVEDLKASIKASGLLQPICVRTLKDGTFEVVAGSRRFAACKEIGLKAIPCNVLKNVSDETAYELATAENIVRENMTAVDEANAVAKLFSQGKNRTEIGAMFGKSARWAEGCRKIVELGDKAMKALAAGSINLGHAEVLTMCRPEDVEKWLGMAKWKNPEELKTAIMNERPLLERAPFDAKKACKNCQNRSDRQTDLFGDVQCCYCLDRECFNGKVKKEADHWRKKFTNDGLEEVPEEDFFNAQNGWGGYIDSGSESEDDREKIKKLIADGVKPKFWVDDKTAEWGIVYIDPEDECNDDDSDDNENAVYDVDDGTWEYQLRHMSFERKQAVKREASLQEKAILHTKFKELFGNMHRNVKAMILELLDCSCEYTDEDGDTRYESYLKRTSRAADDFIDTILEEKVGDYNGIDDDIREFFEMDSRETFERNANEALSEDWTPESDKEE